MNPRKKRTKLGNFFKLFSSLLAWVVLFSAVRVSSESQVKTSLPILDPAQLSPEALVHMGKRIVFGTQDPKSTLAKGDAPIGKGQCPLCHQFLEAQKADRCPNLMTLDKTAQEPPDIGLKQRSLQRITSPRYEAAKKRHATGEKDSGFIPHAKTSGQYLIESQYCPNCFVVEGFGLKGTHDTMSAMPIINEPPILLEDIEIVAVTAYLQAFETPGDYSKVTALEDWEQYFGRKLKIQTPPFFSETEQLKQKLNRMALPEDLPDKIVAKMACSACHKIPGIGNAKTGRLGPLLVMKDIAAERLQSAAYQQAVEAGRAHARTPKEYVIESIVDPTAFITPGYVDGMVSDYGHRFTVTALDIFADFLLAQGIEEAQKEGLLSFPNTNKRSESSMP